MLFIRSISYVITYMTVLLSRGGRYTPYIHTYIAPPPNYIFFLEWHTLCCFGVVSQRFRALNQPYSHQPPPLLHTVHPSWAQPWPLFIFSIVYPCSQNTGAYIYFLMIHISPSLFRSDIRTPPLKPHTNSCLSSVINSFNISFPVSLFFGLCCPPLPIYSL